MVAARRPGRRASSLTELLVGALIVVILFIAASPFHRAARDEAARAHCLMGRRLLADAQERYCARSPVHRYARSLDELASILPAVPRCGAHGMYRWRLSNADDRDSTGSPVPRGLLVVTCTAHPHDLCLSHAISRSGSAPPVR